MSICPCCSNLEYSECCGPFIEGEPAPTAVALVRSRYTAFAMRNLDYVARTHAPEIRDDFNRAEAERIASECEWLGLQIHSAKESADTAEVEFIIRIRQQQKTITKASASSFRREDGEWLYVSSKPAAHIAHRRAPKIGRNDPCHCSSGKKYKKCCALSEELR